MDAVAAEVRKVIADQMAGQLEVSAEDIQDSSSFAEDLGLDSIDTLELFGALEDQFKIKISDEDADKIKTVADAIAYIESRVKK